MGRALPKVDPSARWPVCRRPGCGAKHLSEYDCPPRETWLVAHFCAACTSRYCVRHAQKEYGRTVLEAVIHPRVRSQRNQGPESAIASAVDLTGPGGGDHYDAAIKTDE
jgi:hypothetical protein